MPPEARITLLQDGAAAKPVVVTSEPKIAAVLYFAGLVIVRSIVLLAEPALAKTTLPKARRTADRVKDAGPGGNGVGSGVGVAAGVGVKEGAGVVPTVSVGAGVCEAVVVGEALEVGEVVGVGEAFDRVISNAVPDPNGLVLRFQYVPPAVVVP